MTTNFNFPTNSTSSFQFSPTLDGVVYSANIAWNMYGQRWYLAIYTSDRVLVCNVPLIGSPTGYDIDLMAGYFTSTIVWRGDTGNIEVSP